MPDNTGKKTMICIRCPRGCEITTSIDGYGHIMDLQGNHCKLGVEYIQNEITDPKRVLTTTIRVNNGARPLAPVWTENPVPKNKILKIAGLLKNISLNAPVQSGQVILENAAETGVKVVASGDVPKN